MRLKLKFHWGVGSILSTYRHSMYQTIRLIIFSMLFLSTNPAWAQTSVWHEFLGSVLIESGGENWKFHKEWQRVILAEKQNPVFPVGKQAQLPKPYAFFWNNLQKQLPSMTKLEKLRAISAFVNVQLTAKSDLSNYGMGEYWASPREFIASRGGDCEDYAITKYFALRSAGFSSEDLRILIVYIPAYKRLHALLAANINDNIYIVDNNFRPSDLALPQDKLKNFFHLETAFNENGVWYYQRKP